MVAHHTLADFFVWNCLLRNFCHVGTCAFHLLRAYNLASHWLMHKVAPTNYRLLPHTSRCRISCFESSLSDLPSLQKLVGALSVATTHNPFFVAKKIRAPSDEKSCSLLRPLPFKCCHAKLKVLLKTLALANNLLYFSFHQNFHQNLPWLLITPTLVMCSVLLAVHGYRPLRKQILPTWRLSGCSTLETDFEVGIKTKLILPTCLLSP